jgi:hypothetical protein
MCWPILVAARAFRHTAACFPVLIVGGIRNLRMEARNKHMLNGGKQKASPMYHPLVTTAVLGVKLSRPWTTMIMRTVVLHQVPTVGIPAVVI